MFQLDQGIKMFFLHLFGLSLWMATAPTYADQTLKFGIYASDKPSAVVRQFKPLLNVIEAQMQARLGEKLSIRMQVAKSYEQGIDDLVQGQVDFARFGPASYILAKQQNPELKIIAAEAKKGKKTFNGVIAVHQESPIQSIADLKGKKFAFGSEKSTIGRYLSQLYLAEQGVFASDLQSYEYLGRHDAVGAAVAVGSFDAGALKEGTFKKLVKKGKKLRILASFQNVSKPWIARQGLDEKIYHGLRQVLIELADEHALKALKKSGFLAAADADYDRIRTSIHNNALFFNQP